MKIRVGFIGTGGIAAAHLKYLKTRKDVTIAALCDINAAALETRVKEFGGKGFADFDAMLKQVKLDAVWICTPSTFRREPLLACAERGLPVFCEKPVERSEKKAAKIAAELARCKAHVQIGYVFRSMPMVNVLREAMADDRIHLAQSYYGCNMSLAMNFKPWFYDKAQSGGGLVDQATHNLDLLRCLFGEAREIHGMAHNPVRKKAGAYTIDEVIGLVLQFENGMVASHLHTWVGDKWRNEIALIGEKRLYRVYPFTGNLAIEDQGSPLELKSGKREKQGFYFEQGPRSLYDYENERFLQQVRSGDWSRTPSDYEDGLKTLRLTLACDRAITHGKALVKK